jgi:hypothetical protein
MRGRHLHPYPNAYDRFEKTHVPQQAGVGDRILEFLQ